MVRDGTVFPNVRITVSREGRTRDESLKTTASETKNGKGFNNHFPFKKTRVFAIEA